MIAKGLSEPAERQVRVVLKRHGVVRAAIFGSVARGEATDASDVDVVVSLPPGKTLLDLSALALDLETVLGRRVDIATYGSLNPRIRDEVLRDQVVLL